MNGENNMANLTFKVNEKQIVYTLLGYKIGKPAGYAPYAVITLAKDYQAKEGTDDICFGVTAENYYLPVDVVSQFDPSLIGSKLYAVINTSASKGKTYKNIAELTFLD